MRPVRGILLCEALSTGIIILHHIVIGAFGVDFSSLDEDKVIEGVAKVSHHLLEHGVTAYCPTIVTASPDYYKRTLPQIRPTLGGREGAAVLGDYLLNRLSVFLVIKFL